MLNDQTIYYGVASAPEDIGKAPDAFIRLWSEGYAAVAKGEMVEHLARTMIGCRSGNLNFGGRHEVRYQSAKTFWQIFSQEIDELCVKSTAYYGLHPGRNHRDLPDKGKAFMETDVAEAFERRWNLDPGSWWLHWTVRVEQVRAAIERQPASVFQKICLPDVPLEIVDLIMGLADEDAVRRLASTCLYIRAVAVLYIYKTFRVALRFGLIKDEVAKLFGLWDSKAAEIKWEVELMECALEDFVKQSGRLADNPWIAGRIEHFYMRGWDLFQISQFPYRQEFLDEFIPRTSTACSDTLRGLRNNGCRVHTVHLEHILLKTDTIDAAFSLPELDNLVLTSCRGTISEDCQSSNLRHLTLNLQEPSDSASWAVAQFLPALRWLSISFANPKVFVWGVVCPFATVERLSLMSCYRAQLVAILRIIALAPQLGLTHLRIVIGTHRGLGNPLPPHLFASLSGVLDRGHCYWSWEIEQDNLGKIVNVSSVQSGKGLHVSSTWPEFS